MKVLTFLTLYFFSYALGQTCTFTDSKGDQYDLTPLKNDQTDYFQNIVSQHWNVWINICRPLVTPTCGNNGAAGCQQWDPSTPAGKAVMGTVASMALSDLKNPGPGEQGKYGVTVSFAEGGNGRSFEIDFQCNEAQNPGSFSFENENPPKHYNFAFPSKYACPTNKPPPPNGGGGKLSGGSILLILLLVVVIVYLVAGVLFNKLKAQKNGVELVPNIDFWTSLPGLVKDGIMFPIRKIQGRGGYNQV